MHHRDAVGHFGDDTEIVRNQQQRQVIARPQLPQQIEDLRLDCDVKRRGRLVCNHQRRMARERDRYHHALTHSPRQLMRIVTQPPPGIRNVHRVQQLRRAVPGCGPVGTAVHGDGFGDLIAHAHDRVERRHRFLKNQ